MLRSMTGYGRGKFENDYREITAEVRSVNHRYLDISIKLPRMYAFLEDTVKKQAAATMSRGKVDIFISVRTKEGSDIKITPNIPVLDGYVSAYKAICDRYTMQNQLSAMELMRLPDAVSIDKEEAESEEITAEVCTALKLALDEYTAMRMHEGEKLCEDITACGAAVQKLVEYIEERSPNSVEDYRQRIATRMEELLDDVDVAKQKILTEAAMFADKVAVNEETVRLRSHLSQLAPMLKSKTAMGKKLDFLIQEFNREANTIGSKANDYDIAKTVIELKSQIEKMREQVQNLE